MVWPSSNRVHSVVTSTQSGRLKASRDRQPTLEFETSVFSNGDSANSGSGGVKKVELFPSPVEAQSQNSRLRARRAAVSSVASSGGVIRSEETENNDSESGKMPMKKNTFKITAKFIGTLQKHSNQKSKAERAAAAAAIASYLTDPTR